MLFRSLVKCKNQIFKTNHIQNYNFSFPKILQSIDSAIAWIKADCLIAKLQCIELLLFSNSIPGFCQIDFGTDRLGSILAFQCVQSFQISISRQYRKFALSLQRSNIPISIPSPFQVVKCCQHITFFLSGCFISGNHIPINSYYILFDRIHSTVISNPVTQFFHPLQCFNATGSQ